MEKSVLIGIIEAFILSIPTFFLIWKNWEKKQSSLNVKIIRKKKEMDKLELEEKRAIVRNQQDLERIKTDFGTKMAKLKIDLKSLEQEAHYQQKISKFESGELNEASPLKEAGELISSLKKESGQTAEDLKNKGLNSLNSLKEKGLGQIDKGLEKVKGIADQFEGLKKFIPNKKKEGE